MLEVLARIRHRRIRRQLSPYLDGMLSVQESRRLETHLGHCQACRDELEELRDTVQALAELPLVEAPRSFALTAAPAPVFRPAARRLEFGLRLATAAAAFVLAVVAVGDLLGLPGGGEEGEAPAVSKMERQALPTQAGGLQGALAATPEAGADESAAEEKHAAETPTAPPAGTGVEESTASPEAHGYGEGAQATATPEASLPALTGSQEAPVPAQAEAPTPAATAAPAATATPATIAPPATGPGPAETPAPEGTPAPAATPSPGEGPFFAQPSAGTPEAVSPTVPPEAPAATPASVGARVSPSEPEEQSPAAANEQAPTGAERETPAAEEGGPSREMVVRWLEIGLASGLGLLFVSWILARRRGWA